MIALIQLVFWILVICVAIAYWQWALGLVVLWVAFKVWKFNAETQAAEEKEKQAAQLVFNDAMSAIVSARGKKTLEEKLKQCDKAMKLMDRADIMDMDHNTLGADEMRLKFRTVRMILPIEEYLEKAKRAEFKKNDKETMDAYRDALYEIENARLSQQDFDDYKIIYRDTRKVLSVAEIRKRAAL